MIARPLPSPAGASPDGIERAARSALYDELATFPKPGLVSLRDAGAHGDMDARTFLLSLAALRGFFAAAARAGQDGAPFESLRALGVAAEARMLRATGGANTHRGAIFTLGLLAAAAGRAARDGAPLEPGALCERCVRLGHEVRRELPVAAASHGAIAARRHGVDGARAEAIRGFPHVFEVALPTLDRSVARGASPRAAAVETLMRLVAVLPDTNLLHRGGAEGLALAQGAARAFVAAGGVHRPRWERDAHAMHRALVARRLSPGGSADLLAAALFVRRLCRARACPR